eukprot:ctg_351.g185
MEVGSAGDGAVSAAPSEGASLTAGRGGVHRAAIGGGAGAQRIGCSGALPGAGGRRCGRRGGFLEQIVAAARDHRLESGTETLRADVSGEEWGFGGARRRLRGGAAGERAGAAQFVHPAVTGRLRGVLSAAVRICRR